jgi:multiple sugar transport system substrate-binding protein
MPNAAPAPATAATTPPQGTPASAANPAPAGVTMITIFVGFGTGSDANQIPLEKAIEKDYNDTHKDINIQFLIVPWADSRTKFNTMVAGGIAPDIVMPIGIGAAGQFAANWIDLTPYIQRDKFDMTRFVGKTVELHKYPGMGILGLPLCVYPSVVYYNSDLFDAAGVQYPPHQFGAKYADGSAWNVDKVVEIAKKLTLDGAGNNAGSAAFDNKTIKQFGWDGWDQMYLGDFAQQFGPVPGNNVNSDQTKVLFTDPAYVDALTFTKKAVWDYHIQPNSTEHGAFDKAGDPLGSGLVAMWEIQSWMGSAYDSWDKSFNWDVAAIPSVGTNKIVSPTDADTLEISKTSKHKDQAWEVMKWIFQKDILKRLTNIYSCIPADKDLAATWKTDMSTRYPKVDFQVFIDALNYSDVSPNHEKFTTPVAPQIQDIINKAVDLVMSGKNLDVNAVLNDAQKESQALLDKNK